MIEPSRYEALGLIPMQRQQRKTGKKERRKGGRERKRRKMLCFAPANARFIVNMSATILTTAKERHLVSLSLGLGH